MAKTVQEREETKYVRDLRKQLIRLRKENAQLRKRNHHLEGLAIDIEEAALEQEEEKFKKVSKPVEEKPALTCPNCGSTTVAELELRGNKYYHCSDCGSKGKLKQ